jgi:hypothetical protein
MILGMTPYRLLHVALGMVGILTGLIVLDGFTPAIGVGIPPLRRFHRVPFGP